VGDHAKNDGGFFEWRRSLYASRPNKFDAQVLHGVAFRVHVLIVLDVPNIGQHEPLLIVMFEKYGFQESHEDKQYQKVSHYRQNQGLGPMCGHTTVQNPHWKQKKW